MAVHAVPESYEPTVSAIDRHIRQNTEGPAGDPVRAAKILVRMAKRRDAPTNLALGVMASEGSMAQNRRLLGQEGKWSTVGRSADFSEAYPADFPKYTAA
ncbi:hypothetical protein [Streptomyces sp. AB3(2024)]|uniref:hypothetical protein n=1 Tax=Streptomyces sp. AB3(2024) TaxID=3317321 RepID=UPI0035A2E1D6